MTVEGANANTESRQIPFCRLQPGPPYEPHIRNLKKGHNWVPDTEIPCWEINHAPHLSNEKPLE